MLSKLITSYKTTLFLLFCLALGAAVGTFIENDFGSLVARQYVYNAPWYTCLLIFSALNLLAILYKTKMISSLAKCMFHGAFIFILIGAGLTHYFGSDGVMKIREKTRTNSMISKPSEQEVLLPFFVYVEAFELTRYYGSKSPSEYASKVIIEDHNQSIHATISMNQPLVYKGYKFFQTFYDPDQKGTILSVTKDPGVEMTYIGYALLFLGLILNLFDPKSRFQKLIHILKNSTFMIFLLMLSQSPLMAYSEYIDTYLDEHRHHSMVLSDRFGMLVVQSRMGRMKPFDTLSKEVLYKLSRTDTLEGMNPTQVMLGMLSHPGVWKKLPMIYLQTPKLKEEILGSKTAPKLASFEDFFVKGHYKLEEEVQKALKMRPSERGTYENDVIKVDERLSIAFMVYYGSLFKIFPLPNDENHLWLGFPEMFEKLHTEESEELQKDAQDFIESMFNRRYDEALKYVDTFDSFAKKYGIDIMPDAKHIKAEIFFNKAKFFERLMPAYWIMGFLLLIVAFMQVFSTSTKIKQWGKLLLYGVIALFAVHTFALALRWYISGHAPMSDTYESIIYIAWSCLLFSLFFLRNSLFALAGSTMMAGIFMLVAHLGSIDPEITNLVPVLKSFWLCLHVSVITASYGFLALGCALGCFTLILFMMKPSSRVIIAIDRLSFINEVTLILGLTLLVIGNFLGAIWANESWGRYWGWDPKETWAYISILIYTMILHLRLIPKWYSKYLFAVLSLVSFSSILMTYFGVNFYLAGMHSYATGDPVPIPTWVYVAVGVVLSLIILSYNNRKLKE